MANESSSNRDLFLKLMRTMEDLKSLISPLDKRDKQMMDVLMEHEETIKDLVSGFLGTYEEFEKQKKALDSLQIKINLLETNLHEYLVHEKDLDKNIKKDEKNRVTDIIRRLQTPLQINDEDLQYIEKLIIAYPDSISLKGIKGHILYTSDRKDDALEWIEESIKLYPKAGMLWWYKGNFLEIEKLDEKLDTFNMALKYIPEEETIGRHQVYYSRAYWLAEHNLYDKALEEINKSIEYIKTCANARGFKGYILYKLNRIPESIVTLEKAIELDPKFWLAWMTKGDALSALGPNSYEDAIKAYENVIDINPQYPFAYFQKGNILGMMDNYEEAIKEMDKGLEFELGEPCVYCKKGIFLNMIDKNVEAYDNFKEALKRGTENTNEIECPTLYANCAIVLIHLNELEQAKKMIQKATKFGCEPDFLKEVNEFLEEKEKTEK